MAASGDERSGRRRNTFRSLQNRNFKLYTVGQIVSVTGTAMQQVAQSWLVLKLTDSGVALGVVVALQFLPMLLFGIWGGLLADRLDKRRLLVFTQTAQGILALVLWALVATGADALWNVYVLALLLGFVTCVDLPARQSFTIEMVGDDLLSNAVALNSATYNSGRLIGPAIGGLLIAWLGVGPCFLFNGLSFAAVVVALEAMRPEELVRHPPAGREKGQVRQGLRYAWHTPVIRTTLLLIAVIGTFGFNFIVVLPLLATALGGGAPLYGALTSLMGLGAMFGALAAAHRKAPTRGALLGGAAAFGAVTTLAAAAPDAILAGALMPVVGAAMMVFLATANSTLQLHATSAMRGRVMALYGLLFLGSTPVGGPIIGWVSQHWGARDGLALAGLASLAAAVAVAAAPVWRARRGVPSVAAEASPGPAPVEAA